VRVCNHVYAHVCKTVRHKACKWLYQVSERTCLLPGMRHLDPSVAGPQHQHPGLDGAGAHVQVRPAQHTAEGKEGQ